MRQSSIIIHKGGREEKYEIYVEDYVLSFLKEETGTLELSEFYFYGLKENSNKRYLIYGAGREKQLAVFSQYSLLDEIGCRLTQAGPVFLVKEENGIYEIKGYEVFYQDNREMQSYLIDRKREITKDDSVSKPDTMIQSTYTEHTDSHKMTRNRMPHNVISVQLGIILVALVAIVINSTNSFDKMKQLNQSASEVFFAIENQEAINMAKSDGGQNEIPVEQDAMQEEVPSGDMQPDEPDSNAAVSDLGREEDVLKLVVLENDEQTEEKADEETTSQEENEGENAAEESAPEKSEVSSTTDQNETQSEEDNEYEGVEALSRNVARSYEIERGDTLYTISRKIYGDTTYVTQICELNQIDDPDHIRYGQKIILP